MVSRNSGVTATTPTSARRPRRADAGRYRLRIDMACRATIACSTRSIERPRVRDALERLGRYDGLVRSYAPPFTAARHDALDAGDFRLCRYDEKGAIVPVARR